MVSCSAHPHNSPTEDRRVAMEQAMRGTGVEVSRTPDNQLKLNIPSEVSFDVNSYAINNPLSLERAQSVRDYLAARGVCATRIETAGRGAGKPLADNSSDAGRAKNRRVEIFLREPA